MYANWTIAQEDTCLVRGYNFGWKAFWALNPEWSCLNLKLDVWRSLARLAFIQCCHWTACCVICWQAELVAVVERTITGWFLMKLHEKRSLSMWNVPTYSFSCMNPSDLLKMLIGIGFLYEFVMLILIHHNVIHETCTPDTEVAGPSSVDGWSKVEAYTYNDNGRKYRRNSDVWSRIPSGNSRTQLLKYFYYFFAVV